MLKILFLILFTVLPLAGQPTSWYLSDTGDSTAIYLSHGKYLEILAIDSTDQDTCFVQIPTIGTGRVDSLALWDATTGLKVNSIVPGTGVNGRVYILWLPWSRSVLFNMNSLAGEMYIRVTERYDE